LYEAHVIYQALLLLAMALRLAFWWWCCFRFFFRRVHPDHNYQKDGSVAPAMSVASRFESARRNVEQAMIDGEAK
jgi:hypothetical protein